MSDTSPDPAEVRRALSQLVERDALDDGERALTSLPTAARVVECGGHAELRIVAGRDADSRAARARTVLERSMCSGRRHEATPSTSFAAVAIRL